MAKSGESKKITYVLPAPRSIRRGAMKVMKVMKSKAPKVKRDVPAALWFAQAGKSKWEMLPPAQQHQIEHGTAPWSAALKARKRPKAATSVRALTANISVQSNQVRVSVTNVAGEPVKSACFPMKSNTLDLEASICDGSSGRFSAILNDDGSKVRRGDLLEKHERLCIKIVESKGQEEPGRVTEKVSEVRRFRWQPKHQGEVWSVYRLVNDGREAVCEAGVDTKWTRQSKKAFKAPRIKLNKFPVTISNRQWKPLQAKGVCFSSVTYGAGSLEMA